MQLDWHESNTRKRKTNNKILNSDVTLGVRVDTALKRKIPRFSHMAGNINGKQAFIK